MSSWSGYPGLSDALQPQAPPQLQRLRDTGSHGGKAQGSGMNLNRCPKLLDHYTLPPVHQLINKL